MHSTHILTTPKSEHNTTTWSDFKTIANTELNQTPRSKKAHSKAHIHQLTTEYYFMIETRDWEIIHSVVSKLYICV